MYIRAIIFTAFNGFEKVTTTNKRRLAKVLNTLSKDINGEAKATIKSLDHVYRSEIFNTESPESMQRLATLRADLKKVAADGINIRMDEINEKTFIENGGNHFKAVAAYHEAGQAAFIKSLSQACDQAAADTLMLDEETDGMNDD